MPVADLTRGKVVLRREENSETARGEARAFKTEKKEVELREKSHESDGGVGRKGTEEKEDEEEEEEAGGEEAGEEDPASMTTQDGKIRMQKLIYTATMSKKEEDSSRRAENTCLKGGKEERTRAAERSNAREERCFRSPLFLAWSVLTSPRVVLVPFHVNFAQPENLSERIERRPRAPQQDGGTGLEVVLLGGIGGARDRKGVGTAAGKVVALEEESGFVVDFCADQAGSKTAETGAYNHDIGGGG